MAAAFRVILTAEEDDNRPRLKFTIMLFTDLYLYCLSISEKDAYPITGSNCRHIAGSGC